MPTIRPHVVASAKKIKPQPSAFPQCLILGLILVNEAAEGKRLVSPLPQDLCSFELNAFHDASTVATLGDFRVACCR